LNNTDISTSSKGKAPVSTNGIKTYIKEQLTIKIQQLTTTNTQLMTDKIKTERTKVNLKTNKTRLLKKKNFLIVKKKELRAEIATINATKSSNILTRSHQDPFVKLTQNKLKVKRSFLFDSLKKNF